MSNQTVTLSAMLSTLKRGVFTSRRSDVQAFFRTQYAEAFATQGSAQGERWAGYGGEPRYAKLKLALGGGTEVLKWRGYDRLFSALTKTNSRDQVLSVRGNNATFGVKLPYAKTLIDGGEGPLGERYPGRNYIRLGERATAQLSKLINKILLGGEPSGGEWRQR